MHLHRYTKRPDDWPMCACGRRQCDSRRWRLRHWWRELWQRHGMMPF